MAEYKTTTKIEATATISFNEIELRALDAMTGYGIKSFLKVFYAELGEAYMQPHEAGLISLFETINPPVHRALSQVDTVRRILREAASK